MCLKLYLIALSALICAVCVNSAAVDQSQLAASTVLVVEKQEDGQLPLPIDVNKVPEQCHQPKETGRCFALFYRFAYDVDSHTCEEFIYGGCAGNSNNFESREECEQRCLGKVVSITSEVTTEQSTELTTIKQQ